MGKINTGKCPLDVAFAVMKKLDDVRTLNNMLDACPHFKPIFLQYRDHVLRSNYLNQFLPREVPASDRDTHGQDERAPQHPKACDKYTEKGMIQRLGRYMKARQGPIWGTENYQETCTLLRNMFWERLVKLAIEAHRADVDARTVRGWPLGTDGVEENTMEMHKKNMKLRHLRRNANFYRRELVQWAAALARDLAHEDPGCVDKNEKGHMTFEELVNSLVSFINTIMPEELNGDYHIVGPDYKVQSSYLAAIDFSTTLWTHFDSGHDVEAVSAENAPEVLCSRVWDNIIGMATGTPRVFVVCNAWQIISQMQERMVFVPYASRPHVVHKLAPTPPEFF
ncbi:hypothetical protein MKZ38_003276 [Zalerion maritima]|uniref:Uncharacterized protein n=1 Tax=Zalerion maritima TaxID=339359 RepID=A0AAD5WSJ8_9PEZI|nr:hypothetical protein MKZ38_003276 [Zalerion maritima]